MYNIQKVRQRGCSRAPSSCLLSFSPPQLLQQATSAGTAQNSFSGLQRLGGRLSRLSLSLSQLSRQQSPVSELRRYEEQNRAPSRLGCCQLAVPPVTSPSTLGGGVTFPGLCAQLRWERRLLRRGFIRLVRSWSGRVL